jgi:photosystem II stability/assembly factor-like uncharacterized protein
VVGLVSPGAGFLAALDGEGLVWESGNNGQSWREVPTPEGLGRPSAIDVGGTPASILLAGSGPGLYRRMLGSTLRTSSPLAYAREAAPRIAARAMTIVRKRAGGGTATATAPPKRPATVDLRGWTKLGSPKLAGSAVKPEVGSLAATDGVWLASVGGAGLWKSTDEGTSWTRSEGLPADVHAVRAVPKKDGALIAAASDGVWFSGDAGQTWEERAKGLEGARYVRAIEVRPDEPDYWLAGAAPSATAGPGQGRIYGLYESKDAGKTWARVLRSFPENPRGDAIADIRFDPVEPDHAAAAFESGELWMTLNGGDYWQPFARDIRAARVLCPIL